MPPINGIEQPIKFQTSYESSGYRTFVFGSSGAPFNMNWISYYITYLIYAIADNIYDYVDEIENYIKGDIKDGRSIVVTIYFNRHCDFFKDKDEKYGLNRIQTFKILIHPKYYGNTTSYKLNVIKLITREFAKQFPTYDCWLQLHKLHISIPVNPKN
uniref:hypothetical protein n=1 Tax=Inonotus hispidus TaxID=40469 RepID=UPI0021820DC7|nr:hypothetical protein N4M07_mgp043 [Inonotus hispidus]UVF38009.1 hypothetical protein [Inonotus hispidus]